MQSITVQSHVGKDGILRLQVPVGIKDADLRITINFQLPDLNGAAKSPEELGWPPGFLEDTYGCLRDDPIERSPQSEFEGVTIANPMTIDELETQAQSNGWPPGFFAEFCGSLKDFPEIDYEGDYEIRDELNEISA